MTRFFRALESQHRAVLFAFLLLAGAGVVLGLRLPAAILPEVTFPRIKLIADSGERDTEEMLRGVTMPLEQSIRRVPTIKPHQRARDDRAERAERVADDMQPRAAHIQIFFVVAV